MTIVTNSAEETTTAGISLAAKLKGGSVVALRGDLGAGKTQFVRGLAIGLGIQARVTSPTFTIVNEYSGSVPLFHFDIYRLHDANALYDIGWDDYLDRGGVIAVEWSEIAESAFPDNTVRVTITKENDTTRRITIDFPEAHA
ncbi:tRNA (adenosine(37)-N6)-threonylcarbamoyltransferase complex ATPase subunit type 1 TsaE [Oscillospiraceae bacterium CM]|nr:tRNA (adenosine(37)-N6)-threonylcarbamoyltransferase complex ATPase subunit type 1 TsaE [Oscillospiraceae bacterium CM]